MICPRCGGTGQITETLGERIRAERYRLGLSQAELANKAGISRNGLALIERGSNNTQLKTLTAIVDALGLSLHISLDKTGGE
jgi:transcriptional regulator with XRE-family HTH domain